jgi:hypothetical protein
MYEIPYFSHNKASNANLEAEGEEEVIVEIRRLSK